MPDAGTVVGDLRGKIMSEKILFPLKSFKDMINNIVVTGNSMVQKITIDGCSCAWLLILIGLSVTTEFVRATFSCGGYKP